MSSQLTSGICRWTLWRVLKHLVLRPQPHLPSPTSRMSNDHLVAHPSMTRPLQSLQLFPQKNGSVVPLHPYPRVRLCRRRRRQDRLLRLHLALRAVGQPLTAEPAWFLQPAKLGKIAKRKSQSMMETTTPISPLGRSTKMH